MKLSAMPLLLRAARRRGHWLEAKGRAIARCDRRCTHRRCPSGALAYSRCGAKVIHVVHDGAGARLRPRRRDRADPSRRCIASRQTRRSQDGAHAIFNTDLGKRLDVVGNKQVIVHLVHDPHVRDLHRRWRFSCVAISRPSWWTLRRRGRSAPTLCMCQPRCCTRPHW